MMKLKRSGTLALVALVAVGTIRTVAGEEEEAALCRDDVMRLCMASVPDRGQIVRCMNAHREELSPGCKSVFDGGVRRTSGQRS